MPWRQLMIKHLRRRFILVAMLSVVLVLSILMGVINFSNYSQVRENADETLEMILSNNGTFPQMMPGGMGLPGERPQDFDRRFNEETPFEIRYFSVSLDEEGEADEVLLTQIAAIDEDEAEELAEELYEKKKTSGFVDDYRYLAKDTGHGTVYAFLNCGRDLISARRFLQTSILVSLIGMAGVFALLLVLSKRILAPVAESYAKQKRFITDASHELKTPLSVISSCTDVVEMENGASKWTEGIRTEVKKLSALIQDLVSLSRMDEEESKLVMSEVDLSRLVKDVLYPFALQAEEQGKKMKSEIENGITLKGNEKTLQQLVAILADNALKYSPDGDTVTFTLSRKGQKILLTEENASSLPAGKHEEFFDRFYRGDPSRSKQTEGYGIGLSLAQSIVNGHGGKISAESDGEKICFTVKLNG